jgi:Transposase DDE domain
MKDSSLATNLVPSDPPCGADRGRGRFPDRNPQVGQILSAADDHGLQLTGLHQTRYRGLAKTHLEHVLTALAINLVRVDAWLTGSQRPEAGPPDSPGWPSTL